jgi:hypothetical protein
MKYIKVFESWLNEEEEAKFDPNKPQAFPMLKMTQEHLYSSGEDSFRKSLASMYSRSIEKKEISESDPFSIVNVFQIKLKSIDSEKLKLNFTFKSKPDVSVSTEIKNMTGFETSLGRRFKVDTKSKESLGEIKYAYLIYPKSVDKSKVITKSEDGSIKVSTESAIILILPSEPYNKKYLAIEQSSMCIAKSESRMNVIGQSCSYTAFEYKVPGPLGSSELGNKKFFAEKIFKKA